MCVKSKQEVPSYKNIKMNTYPQCMFIISNIITVIGRYERFTLIPLQQCNLKTL